MEITVKDRQTLLDVAIVALGSAAGVFAFVRRNGISLTARLADGQVLAYDAADIIAPAIRDTYDVRGLSPATDIDSAEYKSLLIATGSSAKRYNDTMADTVTEQPGGTLQVKPLPMPLPDGHRKRTRKYTLHVYFKIRSTTYSHNFNTHYNGKFYTHTLAVA